MRNPVHVLLVEDHTAFREALVFSFDRESDFEVVAEAGSVAEAHRVSHEEVDLAVVDLDLPDGDGTSLIPGLHAGNPEMMVLILTASTDRGAHARTVEAGAAGVLHKSSRLKEIMEAARRLAAGESLLSGEELAELLRVADRQRAESNEARLASDSLTPRELEVLQALSDGLSDKEIAEQMFVSSGTVRNHVARLLSKLEVHSRLQALVFAVRCGLVEIERP